METTSVFAEITKTAPQADGSLLVYGKATGSDLDLDQQRCDPAWLQRAMPEWFAIGNVRAQHDAKQAVGKAVEHEVKADGHWIKANIVDPVAVAKTKAGVFTGFSIGIAQPRISKSVDAPGGVINDGKIVEVSLVDRPCLPTAMFTMAKAAKPGMQIKAGDFDSQRLLVKCEEFEEKPDLSKSESEMTVTLADRLDSEQAAKLKEIGEKATDTGHLDAPAPGQVCSDCGGDGHLNCADFNRDAVKALIAKTVANVDSGLGQDESGDISGALEAISMIAKLIQSEAEDLATTPAQGCDINLLMQAVQALTVFHGREAAEQGGIDPGIWLAAQPDQEKSKYSAEQMRRMLADGKAFKNANGDPSYPIADTEDLMKAIRAVGRGSGSHDAIRSYIKRRAKALGASDAIPENWNSKTAEKTTGPNTEKSENTSEVTSEETEKSDKPVEKSEQSDESHDESGQDDTREGAEENADESTESTEVDKTASVDSSKAAVVEDDTSDGDAVVKSLSAELEKSDSPLRKSFMSIVEASTESTAKSVSELTERLEKVEQMAIPGGPALRRTETERTTARRNDLISEVLRYKALSENATDMDLRKGYAAKAAQLETEVKAL